MGKPSRKKFQEALKALKAACKSDKIPFSLRIRAAELLCAIYGVPLPESSVRVKRAIKEIVAEGQFDRQIKEQIQQEKSAQAVASAKAFLESVRGANEQTN